MTTDGGTPDATTHESGYDSELRRLDVVFRSACDVHVRDRVLDIGCGTGRTTRAAAHAASDGGALGVDVSSSAIERARALSEGIDNVAFACADAQTHPFAPGSVDLAISRFGTMFFDDAATAFTNVAQALRPPGRLVMMVWQAAERNEWQTAIRRALGGETPSAAFSLGDPGQTSQVLEAAGFVDIGFADVDEPVYYGSDEETALAWIRSFVSTDELLERLGPDGAEAAMGRLRTTVAEHLRDDGVWFGSRAWIVTARRG